MASELTLDAALAYDDGTTSDSLVIPSLFANVGSYLVSHAKAIAPTTAAALPLGSVSSLGWILIVNRDATNFITLLTGTGGVVFAKLLAGEFAMFRFGSGVTAPFIKADTATCSYEMFLVNT